MRRGATKRPFYRVVVADSRSPRDGRFIENIGKYHPLEDPSLIDIDGERALYWLSKGAQPSSQVRNLLDKQGIWEAFLSTKPAGSKARPSATKSGPKSAAKAKPKAAEPESTGAGEPAADS
jgi:small subunit ribosomal protein S16